jgi:hypothetical protein
MISQAEQAPGVRLVGPDANDEEEWDFVGTSPPCSCKPNPFIFEIGYIR